MTNTTDNTPYAEVEEAVRLIKRIAHWAVDNPDALCGDSPCAISAITEALAFMRSFASSCGREFVEDAFEGEFEQ